MKKHILVLLTALLAAALSGCDNSEPPSVAEVSEQTRIMPIESSAPESAAPTEETIESTESTPDYPVKNEASYIKTTRNYNNEDEISNTETFDEHGNVIKESSNWGDFFYAYEYNGDGTVRVKYSEEYREEYEYENGLEVKCTKYDESGKVFSVTTHTYDEYGNVMSIIYEMGGETVMNFRYGYELDENGNWIAEYSYDKDGEIDTYAVCVRGENGKVLSGRFDDGYTVTTYEIKYDEHGNEIEQHSLDIDAEDGSVIRERHFVTEYDARGRISRESEYRIDNGEEQLVSCSEYKYL